MRYSTATEIPEAVGIEKIDIHPHYKKDAGEVGLLALVRNLAYWHSLILIIYGVAVAVGHDPER
jgi:hypothetical protein